MPIWSVHERRLFFFFFGTSKSRHLGAVRFAWEDSPRPLAGLSFRFCLFPHPAPMSASVREEFCPNEGSF